MTTDSPAVSCVWCDDPVSVPGETCGFDCYILWYAWFWEHGDTALVTPGGRVVMLEPEQNPPLDMRLQPWYGVGVSE